MQSDDESHIDDYRVYIDTERNRIAIVFRTGDVQMTVNATADDTRRLIDALTRAVQQLKAGPSEALGVSRH